MDVNGRMTEAELLDAEKARRIYEDIVRTMRDPALLEYVGQGLYKVRIFPIEPRADKRIRLKYTELLSQEGGLLSYVYPLNTEKFSAQPLKSVSLKVDVELPEGLRAVYSPSHEVEVKRHGPTRAVVGFESRDIRPDADFQLFLAPATSADVGVHVMTHRDPSDPEGTFLLVLSPSSQMSAEKVVQKDVVFVLDTSGSMAEDRKLEQASRTSARGTASRSCASPPRPSRSSATSSRPTSGTSRGPTPSSAASSRSGAPPSRPRSSRRSSRSKEPAEAGATGPTSSSS
jgi:Ca-activated chloride channel family protein